MLRATQTIIPIDFMNNTETGKENSSVSFDADAENHMHSKKLSLTNYLSGCILNGAASQAIMEAIKIKHFTRLCYSLSVT